MKKMQRDNEGFFMMKDNTSFLRESGNKVNPSWPKNKYTLQFAVVTRGFEARGVQTEAAAACVDSVRQFYCRASVCVTICTSS